MLIDDICCGIVGPFFIRVKNIQTLERNGKGFTVLYKGPDGNSKTFDVPNRRGEKLLLKHRQLYHDSNVMTLIMEANTRKYSHTSNIVAEQSAIAGFLKSGVGFIVSAAAIGGIILTVTGNIAVSPIVPIAVLVIGALLIYFGNKQVNQQLNAID